MKIENWKLSIGKCKSTASLKGRTKLFCILHFTFFILQFPNLASAQVGNCEPALGQAILDAGQVRASVYNNGALFWGGKDPLYEVPKNSGKHAIFASSLWIAGHINGELRGAATRYGPREFWPGPLDEAGNPPVDCAPFDRIWEIRKEDIEAFTKSGLISDNLRNWPAHLGAPVVDGDGDPFNYNLQDGDLPLLYGDQRLWWIMNDRGNLHEATKSTPIGLEVHASAHAFSQKMLGRYITFYDYQFINKNSLPLTDTYLGFYMDVDLGNFDDDYTGSDSLLHLGYAYNSDNFDEDEQGYGDAPPAIGITFLKTAISDTDGRDNDHDGTIDEAGEMLGVTGFSPEGNSSILTGDPETLQDYYYFMQSRLRDGRPMTEGGTGRDFSIIPIKFVFPGDPVTGEGWSEFNPDPFSSSLPPTDPADRRSLTASGPFTIAAGDTMNFRFAIVWSRGTSNLDSVTELKKDVASLLISPEAYYLQTLISLPQITTPVFDLGFKQNFPNPFTKSTTFRYSLPQTMQVRLAVYDMLGREVEVLVEQQQDAGIYTINFEAGTLPSGIYLARIELNHLRFTKRMVLAR